MFIKIINKIILFLIILFLIQPFSISIYNENLIFDDLQNVNTNIKNNNEIYGFIILNPSTNEISNNSNLQYETLNIINDLLRNNIQIYWLSNDINILTKSIFSDDISEKKVIKQGSFFIPFIKNQSNNLMSMVIISKYYFNKYLSLDNNILLINEPIQNIEFYKLSEPNIAYYFDQGITRECINWYMSSLYKAGFLKSEILNDSGILNSLNNDNYNVLIWPGGNMFDSFKKDLNFFSLLDRQYTIKNFISKGGGYVGSCYGAFMASSGIRLTPFFLIQYYFPKIPTFGFFSLSDTLLSVGIPSTINITIESNSHPVVFGLNGTLNGSTLRGGPVYTWLGENSESLAKIEDIDTSWFRWIDSLNSSFPSKILRKWVNFTIGKTIWISSEYNDGKIVSFGDHPEHGDIKLQRAVHNSVFYVISDLNEYCNFNHYYDSFYVHYNLNKSNKIVIENYETDLFTGLYSNIFNIFNLFSLVENQYNNFSESVDNLIENENIDISFYYQMMRGGLWRFEDFIKESKDNLINVNNSEDIQDNLRNIDSIYYSLQNKNTMIKNINIFKNKLTNKIEIISNSLNSITDNFDFIIFEINNYQNNSNQNQYIINLSNNIEKKSIEILKNLPSLHFDSIIFSRDLNYYYKYKMLVN